MSPQDKMTERKSKIPSIALLSANLAWNLLTPDQQQQSLEYLKQVREKEQASEKTQEIRPKR
jgi:hypothetical protein